MLDSRDGRTVEGRVRVRQVGGRHGAVATHTPVEVIVRGGEGVRKYAVGGPRTFNPLIVAGPALYVAVRILQRRRSRRSKQ